MSYLGWFGPYIVAAVIALPPLFLLLSLPSMLKLRLKLSARAWVYQGDDGRLELHFDTGRAILPVSSVAVRLELENRYTGELVKKRFVFRSVTRGVRCIALPTELCGMLRCRVLGYECRDMLGLFCIRRKCAERAAQAVIPHPAGPDAGLDIASALNARQRLKPKHGGGYSEDHDLREYHPGDTVNSIHWKLSSKTDKVIVREPLVCENDRIYLVLASPGEHDRGLEQLYWLSLELCRQELAHYIVADREYSVGNESEALDAMRSLLSAPMTAPCRYDASMMRCAFVISGEEVRTL